MSKLNKNNKQTNMQLHIDTAYDIIKAHLPTIYVALVLEKLKTKNITNVSSSMIRNVKNKTNLRLDILLALVEVAQEHKQTIIDLKNITT